MQFGNPFSTLKKSEWCLWIFSLLAVGGSAVLLSEPDWVSVAAPLIGVTALIFVAKGHPLGQALTIVFAVLYGSISFAVRYYGEMITYLCMTAPMALLALITWLKHPYQDANEVAVGNISQRVVGVLMLLTALVTGIFYFLLRFLGNASLFVSTLSIATSFLASALTALRSPYYALAYAANDVVLIVLWCIASAADRSAIPMVVCFSMFLLNDLYGFVNWKSMERRQNASR